MKVCDSQKSYTVGGGNEEHMCDYGDKVSNNVAKLSAKCWRDINALSGDLTNALAISSKSKCNY